jgi:hypothetical protein
MNTMDSCDSLNSSIDGSQPPALKNLIENQVACRNRSDFVRVIDGWLIAFDSGEWGGALYWASPDGESFYEVLPTFQISNFIHRSDGLFAAEGRAQLDENRGGIIKLDQDTKGTWFATKVVELPAKPKEILSNVAEGKICLSLHGDPSTIEIYPGWTFKHNSPPSRVEVPWWVWVIIVVGVLKVIRFFVK